MMAAQITTLPITMLIQQNFLRIVRKRTQLTQVDIASILKISDFANVSRWEHGRNKPNVEVLLVYHLLFATPIETLFERQKHELKPVIIPRIRERISHLKSLESDLKVQSRIGFLESVLTRLTAPAV
jgi:transcriptional regulator with XRE-family HTH domain